MVEVGFPGITPVTFLVILFPFLFGNAIIRFTRQPLGCLWYIKVGL